MRLFLAADLTASQENALARLVDAAKTAAPFDWIRWLPRENWHATLAFIGDREEAEVPALINQLEPHLKSPVELLVKPGRIRAFPSRGDPRLLVLKGESDSKLDQLVFKLHQSLGLKPPTPFRFHVSVARFKELDKVHRDQLLSAIRDLDTLEEPWTLNSFTLYSSTLHPSGATYQRVKSWEI